MGGTSLTWEEPPWAILMAPQQPGCACSYHMDTLEVRVLLQLSHYIISLSTGRRVGTVCEICVLAPAAVTANASTYAACWGFRVTQPLFPLRVNRN